MECQPTDKADRRRIYAALFGWRMAARFWIPKPLHSIANPSRRNLSCHSWCRVAAFLFIQKLRKIKSRMEEQGHRIFFSEGKTGMEERRLHRKGRAECPDYRPIEWGRTWIIKAVHRCLRSVRSRIYAPVMQRKRPTAKAGREESLSHPEHWYTKDDEYGAGFNAHWSEQGNTVKLPNHPHTGLYLLFHLWASENQGFSLETL